MSLLFYWCSFAPKARPFDLLSQNGTFSIKRLRNLELVKLAQLDSIMLVCIDRFLVSNVLSYYCYRNG
jgi:hypothetical protein